MNKKIALGVSSSIGIYKACEVVRGFQKHGVDVRVVMTPNAARLVSPLLFSSLAGTRTIVDLFEEPDTRTIRHIELAKEISLLCVAPATANVIGKFAGGVADDFLSTLYLATRAAVLIAPAMNEAMYLDPQTQANMARLRSLGAEFVEPGQGYLACGDIGWGRLAEPEAIVAEGLRILARTASLEGRTVLVTAGPTREHLDPVRFLSNPSTGKMGYELAREAVARGARTVLVSGPTSLIPPAGAKTEMVRTADEMRAACLKAFPKADVVVMAAAVSDFRFKETRAKKAAKSEIGTTLADREDPGHPGPPRREEEARPAPGRLRRGDARRRRPGPEEDGREEGRPHGRQRRRGRPGIRDRRQRRPHHRPVGTGRGVGASEQAGGQPHHLRQDRGRP